MTGVLLSGASRGLEDLLTRLFGRLPIGWLQLSHSRPRLAAALAGVAFANILVFLQIGILGALNGSVALAYSPIRADLLVSSADARTLTDGSPFARRLMWAAMAEPGVAAATPVYMGMLDWALPAGGTAAMVVYGIPVSATRFAGTALATRLPSLALLDTALIDGRTRGVDPAIVDAIAPESPLVLEANRRTLSAIGTIRQGGGFSSDGALIVSDQTFFRLFPMRASSTPSHLLIDATPGTDPVELAARLDRSLGAAGLRVRPLGTAIEEDLRYQTTQRPTGVIFGFGMLIGMIVGMVIVYQVLSTDVADHLREYATFKAMGYDHRFFLGIIIEEALVLAILGFLPGILISILIYAGLSSATGLPVAMDLTRAIAVLVGTILACLLSGALATRRLQAVDPAELF